MSPSPLSNNNRTAKQKSFKANLHPIKEENVESIAPKKRQSAVCKKSPIMSLNNIAKQASMKSRDDVSPTPKLMLPPTTSFRKRNSINVSAIQLQNQLKQFGNRSSYMNEVSPSLTSPKIAGLILNSPKLKSPLASKDKTSSDFNEQLK